MRQPRTEFPQVGDQVAALHTSGGWYYGPLEIVKVVNSTRVVEARPLYWSHPGTILYTPSEFEPYPLKWNRWEDFTDEERDEIEKAIKTRRAQ